MLQGGPLAFPAADADNSPHVVSAPTRSVLSLKSNGNKDDADAPLSPSFPLSTLSQSRFASGPRVFSGFGHDSPQGAPAFPGVHGGPGVSAAAAGGRR